MINIKHADKKRITVNVLRDTVYPADLDESFDKRHITGHNGG